MTKDNNELKACPLVFNGLMMKRLRLRKNMTLQKLADYVGSSKSYIWELERGGIDPSGSKICLIANILGAKVEYFYNEVNDD